MSEGSDDGGASRLRVLGCCDWFSARSSGGAERVATEVYARLAASEHEVTLLTALPAGMLPLRLDGVRVHVARAYDLRRFTGAQVAIAPSAVRCMRQLAKSHAPHVLHANGLHFQTSLAALWLHHETGLPLVTTVHVAGIDELPPIQRCSTAAYERVVGRRLLRASARVIAVSDAVAAHAVDRGARPDSVVVVPNGVDHCVFHPGRQPTRAGTPTVLYVGRLVANKGPGLLLDALVELARRGVRFEATFAGDGPQRAALERAAAAGAARTSIRFIGHVDDVASLMRHADVVVRPSSTEGMSLAVLEAMACGRCVVVSDLPANTALVRPMYEGLAFRAGDARHLMEVLDHVLADPALRDRLGAAARARARAHSWDECATRTGAVLAAAADPRPRIPVLI